ncbi:MAG: gliding motility-associated C-terminal domain-containing protein, partial [Cyclobacteriaceae bacterium]
MSKKRLTSGWWKVLGLSLLLSVLHGNVLATHLRAGEITLQRVSCTGLTFRITITVYTDTGSPIKFGDGELNFGDGSEPHITPSIDNTLRPDLGPEVGTVSYTIEHTFGGPGKYTISYLEANRNAGILNMTNSVDTRFFVETQIIIDPFLGCSNTPRLLVPPIDKGCTGAAFYHNACL